jgi:integrase
VHALTFVMIAAYTGMRQAPVLNLRARDIDCDRRVMWIGKEKAVQREQPIPKGLADYLRPLLRTMEPDAYVFASRKAKAAGSTRSTGSSRGA